MRDVEPGGRPRMLIAHADMADPGGGSTVFAWALQALATEHDVTVVTLRAIAAAELDRRFGTSLAHAAFDVVTPPAPLGRLLFAAPARLERVKLLALAGLARRRRAQLGEPMALSTSNELDLGAPALQYVHFPNAAYAAHAAHSSQRADARALAQRAYRTVTDAAARRSRQHEASNLALCNSEYTLAAYAKHVGPGGRVLYPPALALEGARAFGERDLRVLALGRFSPEKRQLQAIEVIELARAQGVPLQLELAGAADDREYAARIVELAKSRPWLQLSIGLSRSELAQRALASRYGLHMAVREHFGIGVVELMSAGCVTLVHDSAGPAEIVTDPSLRFASVAQAAQRLVELCADPERALAAHHAAILRAQAFSAQRFMDGVRQAVREQVG